MSWIVFTARRAGGPSRSPWRVCRSMHGSAVLVSNRRETSLASVISHAQKFGRRGARFRLSFLRGRGYAIELKHKTQKNERRVVARVSRRSRGTEKRSPARRGGARRPWPLSLLGTGGSTPHTPPAGLAPWTPVCSCLGHPDRGGSLPPPGPLSDLHNSRLCAVFFIPSRGSTLPYTVARGGAIRHETPTVR